MLGHTKQRSLRDENVFRLTLAATSASDEETQLFLLLCNAQYPVLTELNAILGKEKLFQFLDIFGGMKIELPKAGAEDSFDVRLSFLPEISSIFGEDVLLRVLDDFSGRDLKVPPQRVLRLMIRNVDIYIQLRDKKRGHMDSLALSRHYDLRREEVWNIYMKVARLRDPAFSEEQLLDLAGQEKARPNA